MMQQQGKQNEELVEWNPSDMVKVTFAEDDDFLKIGVNGEELDGKYKALPVNYRMSEGERL